MSLRYENDVHPLTINLQMRLSMRLAAGHSGQNKTARRSEMRLSKIVRYSASFEFFVVFVLPDLCSSKNDGVASRVWNLPLCQE